MLPTMYLMVALDCSSDSSTTVNERSEVSPQAIVGGDVGEHDGDGDADAASVIKVSGMADDPRRPIRASQRLRRLYRCGIGRVG